MDVWYSLMRCLRSIISVDFKASRKATWKLFHHPGPDRVYIQSS